MPHGSPNKRLSRSTRKTLILSVPWKSIPTWHPTVRGIRDDMEQAAKEMRASRKASDAYDNWPASRKAREMCDEAWKWRQAVDRGERLYNTHCEAHRVPRHPCAYERRHKESY